MGGAMQTKDHWERVYAARPADEVSWFQQHADRSVRLIKTTGVPLSAPIIDVGGGASRLVDDLLQLGYSALTVLDISTNSLDAAKKRLGRRSSSVQWLEADITRVSLPLHAYAVWHDRAVFHFLTSAADRSAYVGAACRALRPGGYLIVATFAEDGPAECSGLPVMRYSAEALHREFGADFEFIGHEKEAHLTPRGTVQHFVYCYCRKRSF